VQTWWTIYEQLENGRLQSKTRDEAQQETHGFSIRRARVSLRSSCPDDRIGYKVELKLEGDTALSDCYVSLRIRDDLKVYLGQMKIPSTYELEAASTELDFISRTVLSRSIADWALSSYPPDFGTVTFTGSNSLLRDLGITTPGQIRVRGMFAGGAMDEDVLYRDGKTDYVYRGYEGKALWEVLQDELEIGVRFDTYRYEFNESGDRTEQDHWTFGVNYRLNVSLRMQVNYARKETRARDEPDLEDDILSVNVQMGF